MRSTFRVASIALAATLLVAACGSEESGSGAGAPTETIAAPDTTVAEATPDTTTETSVAPTSEPEQPTQDVEADTAAAEAALLTVADLPEGWAEAADAAAAPLNARLAECVGVNGDEISTADATASAGPFVSPTADASIRQHVGVLASESDARTVMAFTVEPAVLGCFEEAYAELAADALASAAADGSTFGAPSVTRLQIGPAGDATQAIRVTVPVTADPAVAAVTVDHVVVRSGRSLATITFVDSTEATPIENIDEVGAIVAERLPV